MYSFIIHIFNILMNQTVNLLKESGIHPTEKETLKKAFCHQTKR